MVKKIFVKHVLIFSDDKENLLTACSAAVAGARAIDGTIAWSEDLSKFDQSNWLNEFRNELDEFFGMQEES